MIVGAKKGILWEKETWWVRKEIHSNNGEALDQKAGKTKVSKPYQKYSGS